MPRLVARGILYQWGEKEPLPAKAGSTTVRWNGWQNFLPITGSLSEGTANTLSAVSARKVEATIAQYGRGVQVSDLIIDTSSLPAIQGIVDNLTDSAGQSVDRVIGMGIYKGDLLQNSGSHILSLWMSAKASAFFGASGESAEATSEEYWQFPVVFGTTANRLSLVGSGAPSTSAVAGVYAIRKAVKQLRGKNAMPFADGYFKLVANTDFLTDLERDIEYKEYMQGAGKVDALGKGYGYFGKVAQCQVYESNNVPSYRGTGHSCDVSFIFGQGAYGCTYIGPGKGYEIIIKMPNKYDSSNPFNQWATVAFKITMAAAALNPSAGRLLMTHARA